MHHPLGLRTAALLVVVAALLLVPLPASAEEQMSLFHAEYRVQADGTVDVTETITWDFGTAEQRGIFRDLVTKQACGDSADTAGGGEERVYPCPSGHDRHYGITILDVSSPTGAPAQYDVSQEGDGIRLRVGDPDRTVSGEQTYVVRYRLEAALDRYPSHDELYWNALSDTTVSAARVEVEVYLPSPVDADAVCYEGPRGSARRCDAAAGDGQPARFVSARALSPGDVMTVVLGWPRGVVEVGPPRTEDRVSVDDFFTLDVLEFGGMALAALLSAAGVLALWWRYGRDRQFRSIYYLTQDPSERTAPLFGGQQVVVEYLPPEGLRPAQLGLILDEQADTRDVTATIIDLAVRGYLHITEVPGKGLFGKTDWELEKLRDPDDSLLPYEDELFRSLFRRRTSGRVKVSDLEEKFADDLAKVKSKLYADGIERKWFTGNPETRRNLWLFVAIGLVVLGVGLAVLCGVVFGRALIGVPVVLAGLAFILFSRAMGRRTAVGSEALRRALGFRLYIATAEKRRQEFNEQQGIFARYLPYAIVFGSVDRWAKAFEGIDDPEQTGTAGWYTGVGAFHAMTFSSHLNTFSSSVSSTISSSPSSGGSGFSGGFSGGGGGGGGVGSW